MHRHVTHGTFPISTCKFKKNKEPDIKAHSCNPRFDVCFIIYGMAFGICILVFWCIVQTVFFNGGWHSVTTQYHSPRLIVLCLRTATPWSRIDLGLHKFQHARVCVLTLHYWWNAKNSVQRICLWRSYLMNEQCNIERIDFYCNIYHYPLPCKTQAAK